jgi:hypothetical protein
LGNNGTSAVALSTIRLFRVEIGSARWPLHMAAPSLLSAVVIIPRNPIVIEQLTDIAVGTDNLDAALV